MKKTFKQFNEAKLKLIDCDYLVIENYHDIMTIQDDLIIVDKYHILGQNLKIKRLDDFSIEIEGKLAAIKLA